MRTRHGWLRCDRCRTALPILDATLTPTLVLCRCCATRLPASPPSAAHPYPADRHTAPAGGAPARQYDEEAAKEHATHASTKK